MAQKKYTEEELAELLLQSSDDEDCSSSESSFNLSENEDEQEVDVFEENIEKPHNNHSSSESDTEMRVLQNIDVLKEVEDNEQEGACTVLWTKTMDENSFKSKFEMPLAKEVKILLDVPLKATEFEIFRQIFPESLLIRIAECTNQRIRKLNSFSLVMHYNHLPTLANYWSKQISMGNELIKKSISRDRWTLLASKLYLNDCTKPRNAPKDYYISDVVASLKQTFIAARSDSSFQSIDECMAKFKGRSSLKQYMPMKPIKRGVKIWMRCDAKTGYTYDLKIYTGKDDSSNQVGTLGERVVMKLAETIRDKNVAIAFDRFFTSLTLLKSIAFPVVGTYMKNRKQMPNFSGRLDRGESQFQTTAFGIMAARWMDSKQVHIISNCHKPTLFEVERKQKDGNKKKINCPLAIADYNRIMGGVDLADQKAAVYDIDRKSQKWWKKVFFKLLMISVVNAWIIYIERRRSKIPLIDFLVPLAETMIAEGVKHKKLITRRAGGRPRKRTQADLMNIGDHMPIETTSRKRCVRCTSQKKECRTKYVCSGCNNALCYKCFAQFHKFTQ